MLVSGESFDPADLLEAIQESIEGHWSPGTNYPDPEW